MDSPMRKLMYLAGVLALFVVATPLHAQVVGQATMTPMCGVDQKCPSNEPSVRELYCRGGPSGLEFRLVANPSPANPDFVRMALKYTVSEALKPGSCNWVRTFDALEPPGEVQFDIPPSFVDTAA